MSRIERYQLTDAGMILDTYTGSEYSVESLEDTEYGDEYWPKGLTVSRFVRLQDWYLSGLVADDE